MLYPTRWYCKRLKDTIVVSPEAIPDKQLGWMCNCVDPSENEYQDHKIHWLRQSDATHQVKAIRDYPI